MTDHQGKQTLSDADLEAVVGGTAANVVMPTQGLSPLDLSSMDLETAMMMVQQQRANLLETQLKDQISTVQAKNNHIVELSGNISVLNQLCNVIPEKDPISLDDAKDALKALGSTFDQTLLDPNGDGLINRDEVEGLISSFKGQIDALNNSQQMDMLRLQSLTSKRNEAFDTMTNFIKKMQDSRSSIVGNMR